MNSRSGTDSPTMVHSPHSRHNILGFTMRKSRNAQEYEEPVKSLGIKLISGDDTQALELTSSVDLSFAPELSTEGTSGVYFLRNSLGERCAVFKPIDEELGASRNPRRVVNQTTISKGFTPGHGFLNEYAAYKVSQSMFVKGDSLPHHVPGLNTPVPETCVAMVPWKQPNTHALRLKVGSLQRYVPGDESADFGSAVFSTRDVQQIALLDIRILNCDRNFDNMLVSKKSLGSSGKRELVAIDHAFSFPDAFTQLDKVTFDWLMWPQAKEPIVPELLEVIASIDLNEDVEMLANLNVAKVSIMSFWMATKLLQIGAAAGLSLYDIGSMLQRVGDRSQPSVVEGIFDSALEASRNPVFHPSPAAAHEISEIPAQGDNEELNESENNSGLEYMRGEAFLHGFVAQCELAIEERLNSL